ncbi:hypothetical protein AFLA_002617 [Aspergillus flavus NRRL3357]|nr:hypothetical protein AFLA_002617 [Aspergillus flavus NRRL3357]
MFELLAQGFEGLPTSRHYATNTLILHLHFLESNAVAPAKGSITNSMESLNINTPAFAGFVSPSSSVLQILNLLLIGSPSITPRSQCSRIAWVFSRDTGLPFSSYWSHIDPVHQIPIRTTPLATGFCLLYGLLYIASTAAFNSIINTAILVLNITYTVPQGILATCGRNRLPRRHFDLGPVIGNAVVITGVFGLVLVLWIERRHNLKDQKLIGML